MFYILFGISQPVYAQTSGTVQIQVRGVVAPARYVVIDNNNIIKSITSNTKDNVVPSVYLNSIKLSNSVQLTSIIASRYRIALAQTNQGIGLIYTAKPSSNAKPIIQTPTSTTRVLKSSIRHSLIPASDFNLFSIVKKP
ncbi:MAG: hypothetical protein NVS1B10_07430 [Candidatus Saccharimonadales bacterium]